ncbi:sensor histidine kinase [Brevundimonas sp.]|uniref:sensor histidine kinase n=1 Tax=Brevundimonas sp. TaxID=1871086 RepID=UPI0035ADF1A6
MLVEFDQNGVLAPYRRVAPIVLVVGGVLLLIGAALAGAGVLGARREARSRDALEVAKSAAETAARERETLLKEIHHRVRNSLMLVSSFLHLQGRDADPATREAMERVQARVTSIGVVHETLYAGSHLARVDLNEYIGRLLPELGAGLGVADRHITLSCRVKDIAVASNQATTIGLIVSEAVTNAVKHAFDDNGGEVRVEADRVAADQVALTISDNGKGVDPHSPQGQGSRLLESLARQLRGRSAATSARGTSVRIVFPTDN